MTDILLTAGFWRRLAQGLTIAVYLTLLSTAIAVSFVLLWYFNEASGDSDSISFWGGLLYIVTMPFRFPAASELSVLAGVVPIVISIVCFGVSTDAAGNRTVSTEMNAVGTISVILLLIGLAASVVAHYCVQAFGSLGGELTGDPKSSEQMSSLIGAIVGLQAGNLANIFRVKAK